MKKTLVLYASKYGSTEDAARMMGLILGPAQVVQVNAFAEKHRGFDLIVLIAPVFKEKLYLEMESFIEEHVAWLKEKPLVLVCVSLAEKSGLQALVEWKQLLGEALQLCAWLGGRCNLSLLDKEDHKALEAYAQVTGNPLQNSSDEFDLMKIIALALQIKEIRDRMEIDMPEAEIRQSVIRIRIEKAEFLWSDFWKRGYAVRQSCTF